MKFAAIFSLIVGATMIAQWIMSYLTNQIPELKTEPIRIRFHIAAEMITASFLICSGISLLVGATWSVPFFLIAVGMLFYTSIVSPGYFAQLGQWHWLALFGAIIAIGITSIILVL